MISKQAQNEIETIIEALRKREQQSRQAIQRGYFSSTAEGQQLTRNIFIGYSKAVKANITCLVDVCQLLISDAAVTRQRRIIGITL